MTTPKDEVRQILDQLPDEATLEEIQYHIYVRQKIERGLQAVENGDVASEAEVEERMARWLDK